MTGALIHDRLMTAVVMIVVGHGEHRAADRAKVHSPQSSFSTTTPSVNTTAAVVRGSGRIHHSVAAQHGARVPQREVADAA
jgi:hypothetical protein